MTEEHKEAKVRVSIVTKDRDAEEVASDLEKLPGLLYWSITTGTYNIIAGVRLRDISYRDELRNACLAINGVEQVDVEQEDVEQEDAFAITESGRDESTAPAQTDMSMVAGFSGDDSATRGHSWFP